MDSITEDDVIDPQDYTVEELMNKFGVTEEQARYMRWISDPNFVGDVVALDEDGNPQTRVADDDSNSSEG